MDTGTVAVLAEKPSVARDIARVLGASTRGDGYLHGNGYVVTWAIGHLVALAEPHQINPDWRRWRRDTLPMLPVDWPLIIYEKTQDQFEVVRKILDSPRVSRIVCATDAGREGELIFRLRSMRSGALRQARLAASGFHPSRPTPSAKASPLLKPGADYDPLADAARGRSRADWLVGMNLSRAYSIAYNEELSVGRVQTPTLAMLVDRELAIRNFVPEDYLGSRSHLPSHSPTPKAEPTKGPGFVRKPAKRKRKRCRNPCAFLWTATRPNRSSTAHAPGRPPSNPSNPKRSACLRRRSTTSPNCSGTPTASSASAHKKRWILHKPSTKSTSSSAIRVPIAVTSRVMSPSRCRASSRPSKRRTSPSSRPALASVRSDGVLSTIPR